MNKAELKLRREAGCLTDCVAWYFNVHPDSVPYFVKPVKGWVRRLKYYFRQRGLKVTWLKMLKGGIPQKGTWLVCGDSLVLKRTCHCVVYHDGKMVYDPNYPSKWKDSRATHILLVEKI